MEGGQQTQEEDSLQGELIMSEFPEDLGGLDDELMIALELQRIHDDYEDDGKQAATPNPSERGAEEASPPAVLGDLGAAKADGLFALKLPNEESAQAGEEADRLLALQLEKEEKAIFEQERLVDYQRLTDNASRAWFFVEEVQRIHRFSAFSLAAEEMTNRRLIFPIATKDMVSTAERFIEAQAWFRMKNRPTRIDIGYHFTSEESIQRIRSDVLLSPFEPEAEINKSHFIGTRFRDGIYTANNILAFRDSERYGDAGILVARLKGLSSRDSIEPQGSYRDVVVLKKSYQCLPLMQFARDIIFENRKELSGYKFVELYAAEMQKLVDNYFPATETEDIS